MKENFNKFSQSISKLTGSALGFALAILGVLVWAISGPIFHFSDTWLISIATITDVVIFLMVFSLQYSQNRDSKAIQLKLNELIVANNRARDTFVGLESLTDEELSDLDGEFQTLLNSLDSSHAMHKLHKKIAEEKGRRGSKSKTTLADHAGHLVGSIFEPITSHDKK